MLKSGHARRLALSAALSGVFVVAACSPADNSQPAETTAPATSTVDTVPTSAALTGEWAALQPMIDKYPSHSGLFDNSIITAPLQSLLKDKYEIFKTNMKVESPLQRDGNVLYTSGNKPHEGGSNGAYLLVDTAAKALEVGLWENGKLSTYATPGASITKPKDIRTLLANTSE